MPSFRYAKPERFRLKDHPETTERWLQDLIYEDPSVLGLGELVVVERERRQDHAGRLDLLLADPEDNRRYEVELMLGATDESHIIRTIEYWDIERRRYPAYDHCAVLVAEDITSRFLNLLGLFAGSISIIAIQLNALKVGDQVVLDFVRVLDWSSLRHDDETSGPAPEASREYWNSRSSSQVVDLTDKMLAIINEKANPKQQLKYNRYFIGLHDGVRSRNFVYFRPRKQFLRIVAEISAGEEWVARLEEAGLDASVNRDAKLRVNVAPKDFEPKRALITDLLFKAVEEHQQE